CPRGAAAGDGAARVPEGDRAHYRGAGRHSSPDSQGDGARRITPYSHRPTPDGILIDCFFQATRACWLTRQGAKGGPRGATPMSDLTRILSAIEQGDPHAADQLLPLVYGELRKLAAQKLAREKPGQTLDATALVHEAYLRLVAGGEASAPRDETWSGRGHFFAAAAEAMRRI